MPCFILFSRFIIDLSLQIKVVSSANRIGLKTRDIFGRSFIYNKNKIGPNTDLSNNRLYIGRRYRIAYIAIQYSLYRIGYNLSIRYTYILFQITF